MLLPDFGAGRANNPGNYSPSKTEQLTYRTDDQNRCLSMRSLRSVSSL